MPKAERDAEMRLDDILKAVGRIRLYAGEMTVAELQDNQLVFDAVAMNVLVIGESIGRLPDRLKDQLGDSPWKSIVAVRNLVAHGYPELDERIIWDIAHNRLADIEAVVIPMLAKVQGR
ncbi:MAG: hypothetical protein JWP92_159 [Caulobacter sp.]|nr:hypothetical protein [Caulobacter sp.]